MFDLRQRREHGHVERAPAVRWNFDFLTVKHLVSDVLQLAKRCPVLVASLGLNQDSIRRRSHDRVRTILRDGSYRLANQRTNVLSHIWSKHATHHLIA